MQEVGGATALKDSNAFQTALKTLQNTYDNALNEFKNYKKKVKKYEEKVMEKKSRTLFSKLFTPRMTFCKDMYRCPCLLITQSHRQ